MVDPTREQLLDRIKLLEKEVKSLGGKVSKFGSSVRSAAEAIDKSSTDLFFDPAKGVNYVQQALDSAANQYKRMLDMQRQFLTDTGQFFDKFQTAVSADGEIEKSVDIYGKLADFGEKLFGNVEAGVKPMLALNREMKSLAFQNLEVQTQMGKTAAVFKQLGFDTNVLGGIMDSATLAFGQTGEEAITMANDIRQLSERFVMNPTEVARNFRSAQKDLAYDSGKIMDVFRKLQFTSRATGVSFDSLTNAFGDSMDTFEGSANKAGTLNNILGKSVFNSIDLLGKTESERVESIISGIKRNVNVEGLMKNKFQLKAVAKGMGLSVEDTRRLLTGQSTIPEITAKMDKEKKDPREQALLNMARATDETSASFKELIPRIRMMNSQLDNFKLDVRYEQQNFLKGMFEELLFGKEAEGAQAQYTGQLIEAVENLSIGQGGSKPQEGESAEDFLRRLRGPELDDLAADVQKTPAFKNLEKQIKGGDINKIASTLIATKFFGAAGMVTALKLLEEKGGSQKALIAARRKQIEGDGVIGPIKPGPPKTKPPESPLAKTMATHNGQAALAVKILNWDASGGMYPGQEPPPGVRKPRGKTTGSSIRKASSD